MRTFSFLNFYRKLLKHRLPRRLYSSSQNVDNKIERIRNIGVLAHIDAGKTTTTERMLFYSGTIRSMGEVHHGNTVTDYMEQERQRGITITSAAVSFPWHDCTINLIDTPGHIDFTMEVEQSLSVLDAAVVVLDASAGVEAQTLTVWRQSSSHHIPRLLYANKMDKRGADATASKRAVEDKLHAIPLVLHAPLYHEDRLIGLIDIVTKEEIVWTHGRGQNYTRRKLTEKQDGTKFETTLKEHCELIDNLSSIDDQLAETIIQQESLENLQIKDIQDAIRRCTIQMKGFPFLCGSSYKNIGVQTLMDAVLAYLPHPQQGNEMYKCFDSDFVARAFKVQHDDQRGVLTFLRLYGGEMKKAQKVYNISQDKNEQTGSLYVALADEYKLLDSVTAGNIAVVSSLKTTMPGELLTSSSSVATRARNKLVSLMKQPGLRDRLMVPSVRTKVQAMDGDCGDEEVADVLMGIGSTVPEPVFLCTIEPPSLSQQAPLETALAELQREDASLRVVPDEATGQIVLAGMGELHLEIIKERIIREYKIDVELGALQIAYKETLLGSVKNTMNVDRKVGGQRQQVTVTMSARTVKGITQDKVLRLDKSQDSAANLSHIHPRTLNAVRRGVANALLHGPKLGCPMVDVQTTLHWLEVGRGTSEPAITAAVAQCLRKVFEDSEAILLEPIMYLEVVTPESHSSRVLADLSRRRADIQRIEMRHDNKVVECLCPLAELLGYSTTLRSLSSGLASFTMEYHSNRQMSPQDEEKAIRSVTGF